MLKRKIKLPAAEAKEKILSQIEKGEEIGKSGTKVSRDNFELKFKHWVSFTSEVLDEIFVSSSYSRDFKKHKPSKIVYVGMDWVPDIKHFMKQLIAKLNFLTILIEEFGEFEFVKPDIRAENKKTLAKIEKKIILVPGYDNSKPSDTNETEGESKAKKKWWEKWKALLAGAVLVLTFVVLMIDIPQKLSGLISVKNNSNQKPILVEQTLAGIIWDQETNEPLPGVVVFLAEFDKTETTKGNGKFKFNVTGAKEAPVNLVASKEGYETHDTDATLGNTSFNFIMKRKIK